MMIPETYSNPEGTLVDGTGDAGNGVGGGGASGTLVHPLCSDLANLNIVVYLNKDFPKFKKSSDLQLGLAEVGDHPLTIDAEELGNL